MPKHMKRSHKRKSRRRSRRTRKRRGGMGELAAIKKCQAEAKTAMAPKSYMQCVREVSKARKAAMAAKAKALAAQKLTKGMSSPRVDKLVKSATAADAAAKVFKEKATEVTAARKGASDELKNIFAKKSQKARERAASMGGRKRRRKSKRRRSRKKSRKSRRKSRKTKRRRKSKRRRSRRRRR